MTRVAILAAAFDAEFRARAPHLDIRPERDDDRPFLTELFIAGLPLRDLLPRPMLEQQASTFSAHNAAAFPHATQRIVTRDGAPIGRIMLDWSPGDHSYGVDIAVLPEVMGQGVGSAILRAWLATADAAGLPCRFNVFSSNPARDIYARLGFVAVDEVPGAPYVQMARPAGG
jgi:ribosomal protein S18 acetylase RimI-like enzyme